MATSCLIELVGMRHARRTARIPEVAGEIGLPIPKATWKEFETITQYVVKLGRIPLQLTRPGQLSSGCKRTFQSSSLPRIDPQGALISTHQVIASGSNWRG
ncbi:unnamed protein product [Nezara viridula]|uniref:Uncharacterized protein n=1 Tax=Nezara viridula TaxID=85310 RepID=A0A9P0HMQ0_NEZVI|nr:unnamed protein product [Nezara viridula]